MSPAHEWQPDRHTLYELCVQRPEVCVPFLVRLHGGTPASLREDFCGSGAASREWVRGAPGRRATGVDLDEEVVRTARQRAQGAGLGADRLRFVCADAVAHADTDGERPDVIFAGNFSLGEIHNRARLMEYLARSRSSLAPGGVLICDTYGGESAFRTGFTTRIHAVPESIAGGPDVRVHYTWEQRSADPFTGRVHNFLHFRVEQGGEGRITHELLGAFEYHWRLWSVPELRDAMREAGFKRTRVEWEIEAPGRGESQSQGEMFIVCVVGEA